MTDGKKTDVPGAPLDDSVPTETPKLLQQDLGLDRRAPRPVPGFDQLKPLPSAAKANLQATTPYTPSPVSPEYANTVISERKEPASLMDFAKTQPSAANPVLAKLQADERAVRERQLAERQLAPRPDPSLLQTDPMRLRSPQAAPSRPQPLRQPLASRPLAPGNGPDVITDPMPREAVPPARLPLETVVQRGPHSAPKTDPMQQPDVAGALTRGPSPSNVPSAPGRLAIPPPAPLLPRAPVAAPASRPPAPVERTEISRPAPIPGAPAAATASRPPGPAPMANAPAATASRPPGLAPIATAPAATTSRPPGLAPIATAPPATASRPPAPVERTEISRPAPSASAPPGVVARPRTDLAFPTARAELFAATTPGTPAVVLPQISDPAGVARHPAGPPGVPIPARTIPATPVIDAAPTLRAPSGPQVTPTPAKQVSAHDLTPDVPREAVPAPARAPTPAPQRAAPATTPLPRPALVVPPSFMDLPAAMEKPRRAGPDLATTQPGIPGPYSKAKPPPEPVADPLGPVPLEDVSPDTLADRAAVPATADEPVASDQVLATPASLWRRALASIFDLGAIGGAVAGLLLLAVTLTGGKPVPSHLHGLEAFFFRIQPIAIPALALTVLLAVLYTTLGAFLLKGRTLGRLLLGIRLVDSSGKSPGAIRSFLRAVFAILSFALFLAGFWLAVFDRRGQTLHDKLTRTFVIRPV